MTTEMFFPSAKEFRRLIVRAGKEESEEAAVKILIEGGLIEADAMQAAAIMWGTGELIAPLGDEGA